MSEAKEKFKWHNILWFDESKTVLFGSSGHRIYVRMPPNTSYKPQYTLTSVKHGGPKINIWACFSYYDVGPIYKINGIIDQNIYLKILQNTMLPYAEEDMPLKWVYMQDNDPKHTRENRIVVMEWAVQSPDLNPIENLWTNVKDAVYNEKSKNQQEFWDVVEECLEKHFFRKLSKSD